MKIENLFNTIEEYLGYLNTATEPEQVSGLIDSLNFLIQFLFAFFFGGM